MCENQVKADLFLTIALYVCSFFYCYKFTCLKLDKNYGMYFTSHPCQSLLRLPALHTQNQTIVVNSTTTEDPCIISLISTDFHVLGASYNVKHCSAARKRFPRLCIHNQYVLKANQYWCFKRSDFNIKKTFLTIFFHLNHA